MKIKKILNKYMKSFLEKYGFEYKGGSGGGEIVFIHKEYPKARIFFAIQKFGDDYCISTEIHGGLYDKPMISIYLSQFLDGPEKIGQVYRPDGWYFNTEEQLLGILENQANLFEDWAFDWMLGKKYKNINAYKILKEIADNRGKLWDSSNQKQREEILEKLKKSRESWEQKRYYPEKWQLDNTL